MSWKRWGVTVLWSVSFWKTYVCVRMYHRRIILYVYGTYAPPRRRVVVIVDSSSVFFFSVLTLFFFCSAKTVFSRSTTVVVVISTTVLSRVHLRGHRERLVANIIVIFPCSTFCVACAPVCWYRDRIENHSFRTTSSPSVNSQEHVAGDCTPLFVPTRSAFDYTSPPHRLYSTVIDSFNHGPILSGHSGARYIYKIWYTRIVLKINSSFKSPSRAPCHLLLSFKFYEYSPLIFIFT